ncbi:MAG: hypothetical protein ABFS42_01830 [Candidatus Krumholzibacteriota bacterium]
MKNRILSPWLLAVMIATLAAGTALADIPDGDEHPWDSESTDPVLEGDEHPWDSESTDPGIEGDEGPWDADSAGTLDAASAEALLFAEQLAELAQLP